MKQALEALENAQANFGTYWPEPIAALRLAIEQAERQEPVALVCEGISSDEKHAIDYQQEDVDAIPIGTMLYTAPPQQKKQEPCGRLVSDPYDGHRFIPRIKDDWSMLGLDLYAAPPQRQPLTEEEMLEILGDIDADTKRLPPGIKAFARAIERAHGIGGEHD